MPTGCMAQESAAEAAAREVELKRGLEAARSHATEELNDAKAYLQGQLALAQQALQASEAETSALHEEAQSAQEEMQANIEACLHQVCKAHEVLSAAINSAVVEQQAQLARAEQRLAEARSAQTQAEGRVLAIGLALASDREALQRAQQESAVAAEVHRRTHEALTAARSDLKSCEDELKRCRDRHEADEATIASLEEEKRQALAHAEADARSADKVHAQLQEELARTRDALDDACLRGDQLEDNLRLARCPCVSAQCPVRVCVVLSLALVGCARAFGCRGLVLLCGDSLLTLQPGMARGAWRAASVGKRRWPFSRARSIHSRVNSRGSACFPAACRRIWWRRRDSRVRASKRSRRNGRSGQSSRWMLHMRESCPSRRATRKLVFSWRRCMPPNCKSTRGRKSSLCSNAQT